MGDSGARWRDAPAARLPERSLSAEEDLSGRERIGWNVLSSWGGVVLTGLAGLVLPRLTDRYLGQTALGVWDFGWSVVAYFHLTNIGLKTSINRYVALYRAAGDVPALRRTASSVTALNLIAATLVVIASVAASVAVPGLLDRQLGEYQTEARWVVMLLGASLAVQLAFDVFPGVLAACHRWDLHNAITAAFQIGGLAAMAASLLMGGGLRSMAAINLGAQLATELTRVAVTRRVCPELRLRWSDVELRQASKLLVFGAKASLSGIARLIAGAGNRLVIVGYLGPAALAVFARPGALLRLVETFANKFAFVLTPTVSSLLGGGRRDEIKGLLIESTRFGVGIVAPLAVGLIVLGEPLLTVWMGPGYAAGLVLAILAVGGLQTGSNRPAFSILMALNSHGRPALVHLVASIVSIALALVNALILDWGLVGAALALAVPSILGPGVYVPVYACRRLGVPLGTFVRDGVLVPMACTVPFALTLLAVRIALPDRPATALACGTIFGLVALLPPYWRYVIPPQFRRAICAILLLKRQAIRG